MNGVPGLISGYEGPRDIPRLLAALGRVGLAPADIDNISGANFARLL